MKNCLAVFSVFFALLVPSLRAQNEGAISGTVQDSTGAVLPNATVKLTNHEQGTVRTAQTNPAGVYQFTFLPAGTYDLEVSATGFKTQTRTSISLAVAQNSRYDISLEVGNVSENVTVSAEAAAVNTESGEVGGVVDNRKVTEMPLNGRQMWSLTELVPNVMPPAQNSSLSFRGGFNVAGNSETSNNFLLNGFDNNDPDVFAPNFRPSIDAIEEFNVLTGIYSAQYGYGSGGQVIITTKSGTNDFHGSAFEYLRNQIMDARNFFQTGPTPSFKQNDFGGTVGGPIVRNKTFFFFSYEGLRQASGFSSLITVPTAGERVGDFSAIPVTLKNPLTGVPLPGNIIPPNMINPVGVALMSYLPAPTFPTPAGSLPKNNYSYNDTRTEHMNEFSLKIDHNFSASDSGYATANWFNDPSFEPNNALCQPKDLPGFGCFVNQRSEVYGLAETHIFSPSMVNQARVGVSMLIQPRTPEDVTNFWGPFGVVPTSFPINLPVAGPPLTTVTSYFTSNGFGNYSSQRRFDVIYIYNDNFSLTKGKHTIRTGANLSRFYTNNFSSSQFNGSLSFTNTSNGPTSGYGLADMLLGYPASTSNTPAQEKYYGLESIIGVYVQDDWKVSSTLTLNLGLRWEMNTPPRDEANRMTTFNPATGQPETQQNPGVGAVASVPQDNLGNHVMKYDAKDFGPRLGFAWQPFHDGKTVIRGGAGTFFNGLNINNGLGGIFKGYPYTLTKTYTSSIAAPITLLNPFPAASQTVTAISLTGVDPNFKNPRVYEWSMGVQRQLTHDMVFETDYFGSAGNHLQVTQNINQPPPGPGTAQQVQARRPYPAWGTINWYQFDGNSHYESLQAKLNKHYAYGLSFLASFTWGKSIDDAAPNGGNAYSNQYDFRTGRGLSTFDVRYRFVISPVWELPFGKGKYWLTDGVASKIAGGWQLAALLQTQTGTPLTATLSGNYSNTAETSSSIQRPNVVAGCNPNNGPKTPAQFFNTACFQAPVAANLPGATYTFGDEGRDVIIAPGLTTLDLSLVRNFNVKEKAKLQFRFESFDSLNHPVFNTPNVIRDSSAFGTINSTIAFGTPARQNQAALRLIF
ncbi:MAG TPA: carboxypeptidase regulatory-like domain-containing protein [Bryobacteraceae bacterium]|nr:carboxypeptidase regulatory-like domain-containing protein [Bryobacteraceae bacterium]